LTKENANPSDSIASSVHAMKIRLVSDDAARIY
jgi:hypothetical protein